MKNNKHILFKYLNSQNLMNVATCDKHLWVSSVYYVIDRDFNFYFLSEPTTIHCTNISKNQKVACSIADSTQKVTVQKVGVQLHGTAIQLNSFSKMKWMLALWNKLNPGFETIINLKNIQTNKIKSKIYKIKPTIIKFFNEELYGSEGIETFEFK